MPRKAKSEHRAQTEQILAESSPTAARWLALVSNGTYKKPSTARIDVCKYIINQDLGMPKQKTILAGDKESPLQTFVFIMPDGTEVKPGELAKAKLP